jgi:hypothetical protein
VRYTYCARIPTRPELKRSWSKLTQIGANVEQKCCRSGGAFDRTPPATSPAYCEYRRSIGCRSTARRFRPVNFRCGSRAMRLEPEQLMNDFQDI